MTPITCPESKQPCLKHFCKDDVCTSRNVREYIETREGERGAHGIPRLEWEHRFSRRIAAKLREPDGVPMRQHSVNIITAAELESWCTDEREWVTTLPEEAADEQLSYWQADE